MFEQIHADVSRAQQAELHRHVEQAQRNGTLIPKWFDGIAWSRRRRARSSADEIAARNARRAARMTESTDTRSLFY
jgi:uncharacterized protein (DUF2235 family)